MNYIQTFSEQNESSEDGGRQKKSKLAAAAMETDAYATSTTWTETCQYKSIYHVCVHCT